MNINWFPGHMTKALRMMQENIALVDVVIYCVDSRCPAACANPKFEELIGDKPRVYVFTKSDLADERKTKKWLESFRLKGASAAAANVTSAESAKVISSLIKSISLPRIDRFANKGISRDIRAMIVGVPNSGKSTLINTLCKGKKTTTGDKAGVTRGKQWVRFDGWELLDTPGTLWNNILDQNLAQQLAFVGSVNDDILDFADIAHCLLDVLINIYPEQLKQRYNLNGLDGNVFEDICLRRGFVARGGEIDYGRGARAIVDDFRKGRIGRITLSEPDANSDTAKNG